MSMSCSARVVLRGLLVASLVIGSSTLPLAVVKGQVPQNQNSRMATFDHAGETFFALSLFPELSSQTQRAADVVVFVDTSASQVGKYKKESIELVKKFLANLNAEDRVKLFAVDLDPIPLTDGFVDPVGADIEVALKSLEKRTPLGATDFDLMLETAGTEFDSSEGKNRCVIYVGDGVTRSGTSEALTKHLHVLAKNRISVSSYILGTARNAEVAAVLANHTGGNVFIDNDDAGDNVDASQQGALCLSQTIHNSVFWPQSAELDKNFVVIFPQTLPFRSDRDSILVGTIAGRDLTSIQVRGEINGKEETLTWNLQPEPSNVEFAFLPALMRRARADQGATLPTLGSAGLREVKELLKLESEQLATWGSQALVNGDKEAARKLADAAIVANPVDTRAAILAMSANYRVQDGDSLAEDGDPADQDGDEPSPNDSLNSGVDAQQDDAGAADDPQDDVTPNGTQIVDDPNRMILVAPDVQEASERLLQQESQLSQDSILGEEQRMQILNERVRKQVEFEMKRGREELQVNPDAAIDRLKNVLEILDQTTDLYPATRQDLRFALESTLLSFRQRKLEFDERRAREIELKAIAENQRLRAVRLQREEEELAQLINRFNSLMRERDYDGAVAVTETALEKAPLNPHIVAAAEGARVGRNVARMQELRSLKARNFYESLYLAEVASVPFPDHQWLVYPDPEVWRQKVIRRRPWQEIRLAGSPIDEYILRTLEEPVDFDYEDVEWSEVRRDLFEKFKINIVTDQTALDDKLTEEEPMTSKLSGIRLKFALREMLKSKNATYIVKDEVLRVISLDNVEDPQFLVTNVYNVGDLVAPRTPQMGMGMMGMGGMGMGGMGGGMGGMGGGMGGMGGGMGGMGGGGMFCIQEPTGLLQLGDVTTSSSDTPKSAPFEKPAKGKRIVLDTGVDTETGWNDYFARNSAVSMSDVRETVRQLMAENKPVEVVHFISAAIRNDQLQPWMYEAITLAMRIAGMPTSEIERAVMSSIDLSDDPTDLLYAAQFMAVNGMEHRALRLLKDIAVANPTNVDPYVIGLRAAQKVNHIEGIQWATIGILGQEWPDYPEILRDTKLAADSIRMTLKSQGRLEELDRYENALLEAQERDCYVNVSWNGDADLDVYVVEPNGTICSRLQPRTSGGGVYLGDKYSSRASVSGRMEEQYVLPKGFTGNYQLVVRRVWGEVTSNKVTVSIHQHYRTPNEEVVTRQVPLDEAGAIVVFNLVGGRRNDSLEDQTIQTVVRQQMTKNSLFFAQQTGADGSGNYYGNGNGNGGLGNGLDDGLGNGLGDGNLFGRPVGYQPVIQRFFEGTSHQVFHATTADRLHVIVSLSPNFSQISSVSNFNFFGTAETAESIASGGSGGGGGGGGGGLGGGGGGGVF